MENKRKQFDLDLVCLGIKASMETDQDIPEIAKKLGMSCSTLYNKVKKYKDYIQHKYYQENKKNIAEDIKASANFKVKFNPSVVSYYESVLLERPLMEKKKAVLDRLDSEKEKILGEAWDRFSSSIHEYFNDLLEKSKIKQNT